MYILAWTLVLRGAFAADCAPYPIAANIGNVSLSNDMPILGRQFLSSAYIMVNQDKGEFTLWSSNPTNAVDLVAMDENGDEMTDWCGPEETVTPTPSATSRPPEPQETDTDDPEEGLGTGEIAGIAVGAVVGVIMGLVGLFVWRRRRRRAAAAAANPAQQTQPPYQDPDTSAVPSYYEANRDSYLKHSYFKPELAGSMPRRPNNIDQHHELPA